MDALPTLSSPGLRLAATLGAAGLGAIWGSFFNVCIARIPRGMSVVRPSSHCFACGARVWVRDNIPILSYFLLRGRCRHCGARFSSRYALVEALAAALSALIFWTFVVDAPGVPLGIRAARFATYFALAAVLIVLSFIDLDTKRLPDIITLPAIGFFFLARTGIRICAALSRRSPASFSAAWALIGTPIVLAYILLVPSVQLCWLMLVAEVLPPIGFAVGEIVHTPSADPEKSAAGLHPEVAVVVRHDGANKIIREAVGLIDILDFFATDARHSRF